MRLDPVNAVSSFHYYMWNAWGEEECKITFGGAYKHFWEKWNSLEKPLNFDPFGQVEFAPLALM